MVCLGNICINALHKGAKDDDDDNNSNNTMGLVGGTNLDTTGKHKALEF
jgi:hypothetical protein